MSATRTIFASIAAGAFLSTPAHALIAQLDSFSVNKNGSALFIDTFDDGILPPSAPSEFASYLFPRGITGESGGLLTLSPATAPPTTNAQGSPTLTARATLATNVVPADLTNGLKSSPMTFSVTAVYELVAPAAGESYGIRLADRR